MPKIIYIVGNTGAGKSTALKSLANGAKIYNLSVTVETTLKHLEGEVYIDDFRKSEQSRLDILIENPRITRIFIATET